MRFFPLIVAFASVLAVPAGAAGLFSAPEGCTLEVTVQNRGCNVAQHYRCSADAEGDQRTIYFRPEGPTYQSHIDAETRWIDSTDLRNGISDSLVEGADDPASFSTLLKTGRDDFDFWTESSTGERLHHVGHDILTGKRKNMQGVELEETEFDLKTYSVTGEMLIHRHGNQFISRVQGRFYGGVEHSEDWTGTVIDSDESPMRFSFPGQPGFGDTTPEFDCDMMMVRNHLLQRTRRAPI